MTEPTKIFPGIKLIVSDAVPKGTFFMMNVQVDPATGLPVLVDGVKVINIEIKPKG